MDPLPPINPQAIQLQNYERTARNTRITSIALGMIALLLFAASCALYGVGTLPPTQLMGLGVIPYLGGVFLNYLSLGIFAGAIVFTIVSAVRTYQSRANLTG